MKLRRATATAALLTLLVPGAQACAECPPPYPKPLPPIPELTISRQACRAILAQAANEGVDYKPGVDVNGDPVASADLPDQPQLELPETITVEITPALAKWLPNDNPPFDSLNLARINLGTVTMTGGVLTFNGQPLGASHNDELVAICTRR